jgi:hypothetical protein
MTSLRSSGRRIPADGVGSGFGPMFDAIFRDGAPDLSLCLSRADAARDRMPDDAGIEASAGDCSVVRGAIAARWGRELRRRCDPGRLNEDVLQGPSLLDADAEINFGRIERKSGRTLKRLANPLERVVVDSAGRPLGARHGGGEHADQPQRTRTHAITTIAPRDWPVEDGR